MQRARRPTLSSSAIFLLVSPFFWAGCPDVVENVPVSGAGDGLSYLVFQKVGAAPELVPLGPDEVFERPKDDELRVFLVVVAPSVLRARHPRLDGTRLREARLVPTTEGLRGCEQIGLMQKNADEYEVEVPLAPIAEVRELDGDVFGPVDFPMELTDLSVLLPISNACPALDYDIRPFARTSPAMGIGTVVESTTITRDMKSVFFARGVAYLERDLAAVANARFLYVIPRDGTVREGAVWDVESLRPWPADPTLRWRLDHFQLATTSSTGEHRGFVLASAVAADPPPEGTVIAQAVFELSLGARDIRVVRTRYSAAVTRELRRVRRGPGRSFVAMGGGVILTDEDGPVVRIESDAVGFDLQDAIYNGPSSPEYAFASSIGAWLTGSLSATGAGLSLEPSFEVSRPASGHRLAALEGPAGPRLFGSTNLPAVLRRDDDGWRRINLWLPDLSSTCSSGLTACGRGTVGPGGAKDLVALDGKRLAFSLVDCPGTLIFNPDRDECVGAAVGPLETWAEPAAIGPNHVAAHEGRLLLSGEGGLLVEVVVGGAD